MGSVNKTPNYGLNQWQGNEYPKRTDFNNDNVIIDTQLKANHDATTTHTGNAAIHITQLTCQTSSTIHALTGLVAMSGIVSCIFKADANYVAGNTFTVGGTAYTIVTSGGEALRSGAFLANDIVSIKLDITNTKLYIRQESAIQAGSITVFQNTDALTAAQLSNASYPYSYEVKISSTVATQIGLPAHYYYLKYYSPYNSGGYGAQEARILNGDAGNAVYHRNSNANISWYAWVRDNDYASGLDPETAPCLVNCLILPHKDSTLPTNLPDNTLVFRLDVASS